MKKTLTSILFFSALSVTAQIVEKSEAFRYASSYAHNVIGAEVSALSEVQPVLYNNNAVCFIVNLRNGGWVIVAGDNRLDPIIGYSTEGSLDVNNLPVPLRGYLEQYADDIKMFNPTKAKSLKWESDTIIRANKSLDEVKPLIKVNWTQSGRYRQYCPSNSAHGDAIVGCVAVGMAQAMTVYRYPSRPVGKYSYTSANYGTLSIDYDAEADYDWNLIISGADDKRACARLLYQCGVSVGMDYDSDGSGVTYMGIVPQALRDIFGYSKRVHNLLMESYSVEEWTSMLKEELSKGRPLIYSGYSNSGGHCFNVDGYNSNGLFHFNWGWAGSGNGYYAITSHEYNQGQRCVFDFTPPTGDPCDITLTNGSVQEGLPAGTVVGTLDIDTDIDGIEWKFDVKGAYNILLGSYAEPSFYVEDMKLKTLKELKISGSKNTITCYITATNPTTDVSFEKKFTITIKSSSAIGDIVTDAHVDLSAGNGFLSIGATGDEYSVEVVSLNGAVVAKSLTDGVSATRIDGLAKGLYIVRLVNGRKILTHKISIK